MTLEHLPAPLVRVLKYGSVDAALFPFNILIAWELSALGCGDAVATAGGFFVHITAAFFINRRWTFHKGTPPAQGLAKTWAIGGSDLFVAILGTMALHEYAGWGFLYARSAAALAVFAWDYVLNSLITFKTKPLS